MTGIEARRRLVELLSRRGVRTERVLQAMGHVPREAFVPEELAEFAYRDAPLPIGKEQTISQPLIVALMAEAADLKPGDRVLEVGTGSGYAAAVFAELVDEVYTVERHESLAHTAAERLRTLRYDNVHVLHGDGTLGWPEHAPYDAVLVAAGGPRVPPPLVEQLVPGGRIVMPVGETQRDQRLIRMTLTPEGLQREDLGGVRFVPLIGRRGWPEEGGGPAAPAPPPGRAGRPRDPAAAAVIRECAQPLHNPEEGDLGSLVERIGNARAVLIGESSHGTSEFYRLRAAVTRRLVAEHGFRIVAIEGDWPDAARVHHWVWGDAEPRAWTPFSRFPTWMWRNRETEAFVEWLREWNEGRPPEGRAGFYGLDLYSLFRSMDAVVEYLDGVDPDAAAVARERYGCLTPWQHDPASYGRAAVTGGYRLCEEEAVAMLRDLLERELEYAERDGHRFLDASRNARLVEQAERYYRIMYRGGHEAWNHRDRHMFETLLHLLEWWGGDGRAVVWAHNSHVGDHVATELGGQGQVTLGGLCRESLGTGSYLVGMGTDRGTVMAASHWGGPGTRKTLRPSWPGSYEALSHATDLDAFVLHLREPRRDALREELQAPRLHRAVGVIYRPETELQSHYYQTSLPEQFDSWIWIDETEAVRPIPVRQEEGVPETYPFGV
jgi:protein-L-isoaspartate(D-aspartate) O-methyltransferase